MRDFNLSPRDLAIYERSNDYLTRMNALDPYSREYANVYNDYIDTIDQLSDREFRASLNPTLLDFAPMTRPRVSASVQQPRAPAPVQLAPADNILYRNRPTNQQEVSSPVPISPRNTPPSVVMALGQNMSSGSPEDIPQELASMYQYGMETLPEVTPYGITVSNPNWNAYPYTSAEPQSSVVPYGVYGTMGPVLQTAKKNAQRSSSKGQAESQSSSTNKRTPVPYGIYGAMTPVLKTAGGNTQRQAEPNGTDYLQAIDLPPMMIEDNIKPLVQYINNTTNTSIKRGQSTPVNIPSYFGPSPFMYSPPYAQALSELSEWGKDIPGVYSWY